MHLWSNLYVKVPSFYQDRLGTNRGKALKKEMRFPQDSKTKRKTKTKQNEYESRSPGQVGNLIGARPEKTSLLGIRSCRHSVESVVSTPSSW